MKKKLKDFIVDPKGQWNHPGKKTYIPNANGSITMRGVKYPVLGIDDQGNQQMMYPDQEYQFPGNGVYEIPMAQRGLQTGKKSNELYQEYKRLQEEVNQRQSNEDSYESRLNDALVPMIGKDIRTSGFVPDNILNNPASAYCIGGVCWALNKFGENVKYFSNSNFQDDVKAGKVKGRFLDQSEKGLKPGDILQFKHGEKGMPYHAYLVTTIHPPDKDGNRKVEVFGNRGNGIQGFDSYILGPDDKFKGGHNVQVIKREIDPELHSSVIKRNKLKESIEKDYPHFFKKLNVDTDTFNPTAFVKSNNLYDSISESGDYDESIDLNESKLDEILTQFSNPDFKKNFMKQQQVSNDEYDAIIKNVVGIYGAESKFGTGYNKEPLWLQKTFGALTNSIGPFQINPKQLQTKRFDRKDFFDPVVGSEIAATFLAENLPLLRSRAKAQPGDKHYSENLNQDNYLEYIPYLMNQQGLLKGDDYTKEEKPGRLAKFFGAGPTPTPENKLVGDSEYNLRVKDYVNKLGFQAIPASSSNVFEITVEEPQYQTGGTFNPDTDEFIGFSDELTKAQNGLETLKVSDPNDPRLQAYTDSLDTYNSNNRRIKAIEMLFSRPSGVTWDEYTKVADVTNFPKINWSIQTQNPPVKFIGNTSDGNSVTRQHSFKKPIQRVVYEEPREIISFDNLDPLKSLNIPISDNVLNLNLSKRGTGEPFKPSRVVLREMGNIRRYNSNKEGVIKEPYKNSHEVYMDDKKGWRKVSPDEYQLLIKQYPGSDKPSGWTKPIKKAQDGLQIGYQKMAPVSTAVNSNLRPIDISKLPQNNSNVFQSTFKTPYQELEDINQAAHARYMNNMSKVDKWPELSGKTVNLTTDRYRGANVPVEYIDMLTNSAKRFKIDPYLLYAIAGRESTFGQGLDTNKERQSSPFNLVSGWNISQKYEPYDYTRFLADNKTPKVTLYKDKLGYHYGIEYGDDYEGSMSEMNNYIKNKDLVNKYKKKLESTPQNNYSNPYDFLSEFIIKNGVEKYNPGDPDYKNKINKEIALLKKDAEFSKYVNNIANRTLVNKKTGGTFNPETDEFIGYSDELDNYQKKGQVKPRYLSPEQLGGYQKMESDATSTNVPNIARVQRDPIERKDLYKEREKAYQDKIKKEKQRILNESKNSDKSWWNQTVSGVEHPNIDSYAQQMAEKKVSWNTQPLDEKVKHYATETAFGVIPEMIPLLNSGRKGYKVMNQLVDEVPTQLPGSPVASSVDDVGKGLTQIPQAPKPAWQMQEMPGLHLKSTMEGQAISKIVEPKTGLVNVEQALGIIGKESGGAEKVAMIRKGLGDKLPQKMDYNEFRKVTQDQAIILEKQIVPGGEYGVSNLGYDLSSPKIKTQKILLSNKSKFGRGSGAHGNPDETLGHIHELHDADLPDVLTVTQIQSDAFQGTHRSSMKTKDQVQFSYDRQLEHYSKNKEKLEGITKLPDGNYQFADGQKISKGAYDNMFSGHKENLALSKAELENFTQKQLLDKNHQERYLQELVDYAGKRGDVNKMRLPTEETAAKVQGYKQKRPEGLFVDVKDGTYEFRKWNSSPSEYQKISKEVFDSKQMDPLPFKDSEKTILKKYKDNPKLLKKLFGEEPKIVTDSKGNTWYEFDIPDKAKKGKMEIKAFTTTGAAIGTGAATYGTYKNGGTYNPNTDEFLSFVD